MILVQCLAKLQAALITPATFGYAKAVRKHRDKFSLDYEYMKNIPLKERGEQLEKIMNLKKIQRQFKREIPSFPVNEPWDYHGTNLMTYTWEPPSHVKTRGVLVFFHSLNGHTGNFGEFARALASSGFVVTGFDFVNFGQSEGTRRGCLQSYDDLVTSAEQYVIKMKTKYPSLKIFSAGMSLGGGVTFNVLLKNPSLVDGAILLSPSIKENTMHHPILKKFTLLFSMVFPYQQLLKQSGRLGTKYSLDDYSKKDPHIYHGRLYPKSVQELLLAMGQARKQFSSFTTPYLLIQSGRDKLVDPFACFDLEEQSPCNDKTTIMIYDMWHAIWLEDYVSDVILIMEEWLHQRT